MGWLSGFLFFNIPIWPIFLLFLVWLILTVIGSSIIGLNYHFISLNSHYGVQKNQIALTFDDGPHPEFTPRVLQLLKNHNAKGTFFCIGKHIELYPDVFKSIIEEGHTIGNHTYSHANNFGFFNTNKVIDELRKTNTIAVQESGLVLRLFRPAFGVTNPSIKRALKITKLQSIGWNKRSFDTTMLSEKAILNRVTKNLKRGDIILLHDSSEKSIRVLEQLLLFLQKQHLESVTVDTLFNIKAYA